MTAAAVRATSTAPGRTLLGKLAVTSRESSFGSINRICHRLVCGTLIMLVNVAFKVIVSSDTPHLAAPRERWWGPLRGRLLLNALYMDIQAADFFSLQRSSGLYNVPSWAVTA